MCEDLTRIVATVRDDPYYLLHQIEQLFCDVRLGWARLDAGCGASG